MEVDINAEIDEYFSREEEVVGRTKMGNRELVVTDQRLIITDREGKGTPTLDVRHERLNGVRTEVRADQHSLYYAGASLIGGIAAGLSGYVLSDTGTIDTLRELRDLISVLPVFDGDLISKLIAALSVAKWGLFAAMIVGVVATAWWYLQYRQSNRAFLVINQLDRTPIDLRAPTKDDAERAERELTDIYDRL